MKKKNYKMGIGIFALILTMALFAACGGNNEEDTKSQNTETTENTQNTQQDVDDEEQETGDNKTEDDSQTEQTEVPIYSINDESLESEQTYVVIEELTPESVVQAVVDSLAEHSLEVGIESVTMEGDTVIVSFLFGKAPLTSVGSTVEETILNSIADSLLDNVDNCKKVIFRAEGEAYESGHYAFGIDEVYASE